MNSARRLIDRRDACAVASDAALLGTVMSAAHAASGVTVPKSAGTLSYARARRGRYGDRYEIGMPGVPGGDYFAPFAVDYVNGVKQIALRPEALPDGVIGPRHLAVGTAAHYATAAAPDVTKTVNQWNNSGAGDIVLSATYTAHAGSTLIIDFSSIFTSSVGLGLGNGSWVKLKVAGSVVDTFPYAPIQTSDAYGTQFQKRYVVHNVAGGATTIEIDMYLNGTASYNVTAKAPSFIIQELPNASVADISTTITPSKDYRTSLVGGSGGTSGSFSSVDIGTADPYRIVAVIANWRSSVNTPTMTIAGVVATRVTNLQDWWGSQRLSALFVARVPTGTTADIVLSIAGSPQDINIHVWKIVAASVMPSYNYSYSYDGAPGTVVMTPISVVAGEVLIGAIYGAVDGAATFSGTWSGAETLSERADGVAVDGRYGAYDLTIATTSARTLSMASSSGAAQPLVGISARWK
jgi:hypothetical protein